MKDQTIHQQLNNLPAIATSILMGVAALTMFLYLPLFVGAITEQLALTQNQIGLLAAADLLGLGIGSFVGVFWVNNVNWRWATASVLASILLFNQSSIWQLDNTATLMTLRFLAGIGQGSLMAIYSVHVAQTAKPEKIYGYFLAVQTIVAGLGLFLLPDFIKSNGVAAVLNAQNLLVGISLILVLIWMPQYGYSKEENPKGSANWNFKTSIFGLFALLLFFVAQGGVWAFMERIGNNLSLESSFVSNTLSLAMIGAFCGAMTAVFLGRKVGRKLPLISVAIGQTLCLALLFSGLGNWSFLIAAIIFVFFWNIGIPYMIGILIGIDPSGKTVIGANPIFALGASIAPILISFFLTGSGFTIVGYVGGTAVILSVLLFLQLVRKIKE